MFKLILPADRVEPDMAAVALGFGLSIADVEDRLGPARLCRWLCGGDCSDCGDRDDPLERRRICC